MYGLALLSLLPLALAAPSVVKRDEPAPVLRARSANLIEGKYIVKLKSGVAGAQSAIESVPNANVDHVYDMGASFQGFVLSLDSKQLETLRSHPEVDYIEQDATAQGSSFVSQENAPWGLARISHQTGGNTEYVYDSSAGAGTCSYVIDTGIYADHPDFEGRATFLANFAKNDNIDRDGHGTHVAGILGSRTYGVAKKTQLFGIKVFGDDGRAANSATIAAMNLVLLDSARRSCPAGVVANLSLGGDWSEAVNRAVAALVEAGVFVAAAAGNAQRDAFDISPASEPTACTVGSTDFTDTISIFSNYGSVVDILAPGSDIQSTWIDGTTRIISGTSQASPHVAGIAAYLMGLGVDRSARDLCAYIQSTAHYGLVSGLTGALSGTINALAFNGATA